MRANRPESPAEERERAVGARAGSDWLRKQFIALGSTTAPRLKVLRAGASLALSLAAVASVPIWNRFDPRLGVWILAIAVLWAAMAAGDFFAVAGESRDADEAELALTLWCATDPESGPWARAEGFIVAWLTCEGDLAQYVTPTCIVQAADPAPFATVVVSQICALTMPDEAAGVRTIEVLAFVECTRTDGTWVQADIPLTVVCRAGRWEIDSVGAPVFIAEPMGMEIEGE